MNKLARKLAVVLFLVGSVVGEVDISPDLRSCCSRVVDAMLVSDFQLAFSICDSLAASDENEPIAPLLRLFVLGMRDLDYDLQLDSSSFVKTHRRTMELITSYEERHGRSSYTITLAGFANANHAAYYLNQSKYFSAIGTGLEALRQLARAKELDSTNADVDFYLGMYDYAKGELRKRLWMVMFWYPGSKADGLRKMENCAANATISARAAQLALVDIHTMEGRMGKAQALLDTLTRAYPSSRFVMWSEGKHYSAVGEHGKAAAVFDRLSRSYEAAANGGHNALQARARQVESLVAAGHCDEAAEIANKVAKRTQCSSCKRDADACKKIVQTAGKCGD